MSHVACMVQVRRTVFWRRNLLVEVVTRRLLQPPSCMCLFSHIYWEFTVCVLNANMIRKGMNASITFQKNLDHFNSAKPVINITHAALLWYGAYNKYNNCRELLLWTCGMTPILSHISCWVSLTVQMLNLATSTLQSSPSLSKPLSTL